MPTATLWAFQSRRVHDTSRLGLSNLADGYGAELDEAATDALLEYLKSP